MSTSPSAVGNKANNGETPLQQVSMNWAKERIIKNLFRRFQGSNPDMEEKLQAAHRAKYGVEMRKTPKRDVRACYLESPPGHGKTTTHKEACREFANLMGLRFVENPTLQQLQSGKIDRDCFVFTTINLGGATSKHEIGGLMAKLRVGEHEFMGHLPDWRLAAVSMAGFGYALFDDYVTSSHQVQNACLDMLLGGSAGDLQFNIKDMQSSNMKLVDGQLLSMEYDKNKADAIEKLAQTTGVDGASTIHLGLAGNRGIRDGNKTFPLVTATATRIERMDVFDTLEAFISRAERRYTDDIGDAHYSLFLKQNPEIFSIVAKPDQGILPQMPCPRTHDALMDSICDLIHDHGGMAAIAADDNVQAKVVHEIEILAGINIGRIIHLDAKDTDNNKASIVTPATMVSGFYTELFLGAIPKAEELIKHGIMDVEGINKLYNNGAEGKGMNFGYQYASALAQVAATDVAHKINSAGKKAKQQLADLDSPLSKSCRETMMRLSYGLCHLQAAFVSFSLNKFTTRLGLACPDLFVGTGAYVYPEPEVIRMMIVGLVKDNTRFQTKELHTTFVDAISHSSNVINSEFDQGRDKTITDHLAKVKEQRKKASDAMANI